MSALISYALICPEAEIASGEAVMVTAPGSEGEFGIRASHAPFATLLRAGCVIIEDEQGAKNYFFVSSGFLRADEKSLVILADEAQPVSALNAAELAQSLKDARDDMLNAEKPERRKEAGEQVAAPASDAKRHRPRRRRRRRRRSALARQKRREFRNHLAVKLPLERDDQMVQLADVAPCPSGEFLRLVGGEVDLLIAAFKMHCEPFSASGRESRAGLFPIKLPAVHI